MGDGGREMRTQACVCVLVVHVEYVGGLVVWEWGGGCPLRGGASLSCTVCVCVWGGGGGALWGGGGQLKKIVARD